MQLLELQTTGRSQLFCGTAVGDFLPVQLIYAGKTTRCHAKFQFLSDWLITHSQKHWSNEATILDYIDNVIFSYVNMVTDDLGVGRHFQPLQGKNDGQHNQVFRKAQRTLCPDPSQLSKQASADGHLHQ